MQSVCKPSVAILQLFATSRLIVLWPVNCNISAKIGLIWLKININIHIYTLFMNNGPIEVKRSFRATAG